MRLKISTYGTGKFFSFPISIVSVLGLALMLSGSLYKTPCPVTSKQSSLLPNPYLKLSVLSSKLSGLRTMSSDTGRKRSFPGLSYKTSRSVAAGLMSMLSDSGLMTKTTGIISSDTGIYSSGLRPELSGICPVISGLLLMASGLGLKAWNPGFSLKTQGFFIRPP